MLTQKQRLDLVVSASALLFGAEWQRALARNLGGYHPDGSRESIDDRLVRRWVAGERPVPNWVVPALMRIAEPREREISTMVIRLRHAQR